MSAEKLSHFHDTLVLILESIVREVPSMARNGACKRHLARYVPTVYIRRSGDSLLYLSMDMEVLRLTISKTSIY